MDDSTYRPAVNDEAPETAAISSAESTLPATPASRP